MRMRFIMAAICTSASVGAAAQIAPIFSPPSPPTVVTITLVRGGTPLTRAADWVTSADYPAGLPDIPVTSARAKLTVDKTGKITGCAIDASAGAAALDEITCRLLPARVRFVPTQKTYVASVTIPWANIKALAPAAAGMNGPFSRMTAATPTAAPQAWLEGDDARRYSGVANLDIHFRLVVDGSGNVTGCTAKGSDPKQADMESITCRLISKHAKFWPARDGDGNPMTGVHKGYVHWRNALRPPPPQAPRGPNVVITQREMPAGWGSPISMTADVLVGPDGKASDCAVHDILSARPAGQPKQPRVSLIPLGQSVCGKIVGSWSTEVAQDKDGKPLAAVHSLLVLVSQVAGG